MTKRFNSCIVAACIVISVTALISLGQAQIWDGGFEQAEFQVEVRSHDGSPIKGIALRVVNENNDESYFYPVTDYTRADAITTDENGIMVFHHINLSPEFGGKCRQLFWTIPLGKCSPPRYWCRFVSGQETLYSLPFVDLYRNGDSNVQKLKRTWQGASSERVSMPEHLRPERISPNTTLEFRVYSRRIIVGQN